MKRHSLDIAILTIILFGVLILGDLSYKEYLNGGICPKFSLIPACHIGFVYFLLLFIFQVYKKVTIVFIILAGFALTFMAFASIGHLFGTIQCPISEIGIPTCFIGFSMLFVIIVLKFIQVKVERLS